MSYGAITIEPADKSHPSKGSTTPTTIVQKSRKTFCTSFAEFLESRTMHWIILFFVVVDILALVSISLDTIRLEEIFIKYLLNLIFVINVAFVVDVLLRLIVFGPYYFFKGKHGYLHGFDALLVIATLSVELFLKFKKEEAELLLLSLRFWRISKLWNVKENEIINNNNPSFHIVLVMDRSGSMNGTDITPSEKSYNFAKLRNTHNNRLGTVYDAVYSFMTTRVQTHFQQSAKSPLLVDRVDRDTISLILFDDEAEVAFENKKIDADLLFNEMIKHETRGGTDFAVAIDKVNELINKHFDATKTNIVIFLSDGEADVPEYDLDSICKRNAERNSPLYLHTVLFGPYTGSESLKRLVDIANKYIPPGSKPCQFTRVMNEIVLTDLFTGMATSLREHKPEHREIRWWLFQILF